MVEKWRAGDILGLAYVCAWSVSMYPPILTNWRERSSTAVSKDFVILNTTGYLYLLISLILQLYLWLPTTNIAQEESSKLIDTKPKVTQFDFLYCFHGFLMNIVLVTQVLHGKKLWKFESDNHQIRMKPYYRKILLISLTVFGMITLRFVYLVTFHGWDNLRTLSYCNNLFVLKITMSLIKYIPQVLHNYDRKSVKGFAIQSVMLDITGGIASLLQLVLQIRNDRGFNITTLVANFGKIGLSLVTLVFNFIFISQWLVYQDSELSGSMSNMTKLS